MGGIQTSSQAKAKAKEESGDAYRDNIMVYTVQVDLLTETPLEMEKLRTKANRALTW